MRTIVNNDQVPHLWAHQSQDYAKGNGSIRFDGVNLYSYSALIGRIEISPVTGEQVYILSSNNYSPTTSKHISYARRAIPAGRPVFYADLRGYRFNPNEAIDELITENNKLAAKAGRARQNRGWITTQYREGIELIANFARLFNLPYDKPDTSDIDAEIIRLRDLEAGAAEERKKAAEAAQDKLLADQAEHLAAWMAGEAGFHMSWNRLPYDYLRINPADSSRVQTSRGLEVPLEDVKKAVPMVLRVLHGGDCRLAPAPRIGGFEVLGIIDGLLHVGCHKFEPAEVERFAAVIA